MKASEVRVGLGFDAHRSVPERPLVLGGVRIRDHDGLAGHSDADVLTHAIIDALLGAAGLADIGALFPDTDERYAGVESLLLLREAMDLLRLNGWEVVNVDAVVVCQEPKLSPYRSLMCERLAAALGVSPGQVHVKGKTSEGLGFTGRSEGVAAEAVALLRRVEGR